MDDAPKLTSQTGEDHRCEPCSGDIHCGAGVNCYLGFNDGGRCGD